MIDLLRVVRITGLLFLVLLSSSSSFPQTLFDLYLSKDSLSASSNAQPNGSAVADPASTASCPSPEDRLVAFINSTRFDQHFESYGVDPRNVRAVFMTLNHRENIWSAWRMSVSKAEKERQAARQQNGASATHAVDQAANQQNGAGAINAADLKPVKVPRNREGVPTVAGAGSDRVVFVLTDTNPALYSISKTTTMRDVPGLDNLKKIIAAFGGVAKIIVQDSQASLASFDGDELLDAAAGLRTAHEKLLQATESLDRTKRKTETALQYAEIGLTPDDIPVAEYPDAVTTARTAIDSFREALATFETEAGPYSCTAAVEVVRKAEFSGNNSAEDRQLAAALLSELRRSSCDNAAISHAERAIQSLDKGETAAYLDIADLVEALTTWGNESLDQTDDLLTNAVALTTFGQQYSRLTESNDPCALTTGMIIAASSDDILIDSIGTATVTISEESPLGGSYIRRANAGGERKFELHHRVSSRLAYGVGLVYTPIEEPKFGAITNPLNEDEKVVAKTGVDSRTGDVALLASYRFFREGRTFRPGIQFGIGTSDDTPLYLGGSLDLGRYFRLGAGLTGQQVSDLARGYTALRRNDDGSIDPLSLTVISADDEIPTRNRFTTGFYAALIISLDSIPFFSSDEGVGE